MREYLLQFMSEEAAMGVQFLLALLVVLILFGVFVWFLRLITGKRPRKAAQRQNRLAILDRTRIDETRSLLLVRRDDVEHLVMIGGPSDVVVEANIDPYEDEEDEEADGSGQKPGHQIARRVIAQRPLRTMSLSGSAAKVAESIGLTASSRPEATLAPPPPSSHQPAAEPERKTGTVEPAEIRPVAAASERAPRAGHKDDAADAVRPAEPAEPVRPVQPVRQEPRPSEPALAAMSEIRPQSKAPTVAHDIELHEEPAPDDPQPDLAAEFEHALRQEMEEADKSSERAGYSARNTPRPPEPSSPRNAEPKPQRNAPVSAEPRSRPERDSSADRQNFAERQQADLAAGFAAAMSPEPEAPRQPAYTQDQRERDDLALEDAVAGMLREGQPNFDASDRVESSVYSPSESVPDGTERPVDSTRPGRVDDEMSRLLQELAAPSRA